MNEEWIKLLFIIIIILVMENRVQILIIRTTNLEDAELFDNYCDLSENLGVMFSNTNKNECLLHET